MKKSLALGGCLLIASALMPAALAAEAAQPAAAFTGCTNAAAALVATTSADTKRVPMAYLEKNIETEALSAAEKVGIYTTMAINYGGVLADYAKQVQTYRKALDIEKAPASLLTLNAGLADAYAKLTDLANQKAVLESILTQFAPLATNSACAGTIVATRLKLALLYHQTLGDHKKAQEEYEKGLEAARSLPPVGMDGNLINAIPLGCLDLAGIYRDTKQPEKGLPLLLSFMEFYRTTPSSLKVTMDALCEAAGGEAQLESACTALRSNMAACATSRQLADMLQPVIVKLLLKQGKAQDALCEAKAYFYTCPTGDVAAAMDLVAASFKAVDHNLARANRFLKYQKFGPAGEDGKPGTADDIADVLREVPATADPARTRLYEGAVAAIPVTWTAERERARFCVYLDQPAKGLEALERSFDLCPPNETDLQSCVDALTDFIIRYTKDTATAEALVQYIMFGPAGKDGKAGTADDIEAPIPKIAQELGRKTEAAATTKPAVQ